MNLHNPPTRHRLIYWVHVAILLPELVMFVYLFIQLLLRPLTPNASSSGEQIIIPVIGLIISPITVAVGLFCIHRAPGNIVGVMLAIWGCSIIQIITLDETPWISALDTVLAGVIWPATFFLFSYFPDGKIFPPHFQKWMDGFVIITYLVGLLSGFAAKNAISREIPNGLYIAALAPFNDLLLAISFAGALGVGIGVGTVLFIIRFRQTDIKTRQQIKWLLFGFFPLPPSMVLLIIVPFVPALKSLSDIGGNLLQLWLMVFPVIAIGNAILRHRLYDIDIIIRRTLIYSVLSSLLALVFFGGVTLVQAIFRSFTGEVSDLAIVVSTLAIAALFTPLRRRVQNTIDRRFYRRKYDAEQTLAQFAVLARDEVDVEKLKAAMVGVVQETMQPTSVGVWVREPQKVIRSEQKQ